MASLKLDPFLINCRSLPSLLLMHREQRQKFYYLQTLDFAVSHPLLGERAHFKASRQQKEEEKKEKKQEKKQKEEVMEDVCP